MPTKIENLVKSGPVFAYIFVGYADFCPVFAQLLQKLQFLPS